MSYILDALRKSDQQRQHGAAPTLASVQFPVAETRQRKYFWLAGVAGVLFVAGILIGWWQPWQPVQPPSAVSAVLPAEQNAVVQAPAASAAFQPRSPAAAVPPAEMAVPERVAASPAPKAVAAPPALPAAGAVPAVSAPTAAPALASVAPTADDMRTEKSPRGTAARPADAAAPATEKRATEPKAVATVMSRSELPASVQQELPRFAVALHAYSSTPGNRLVSINDQLLHEGDSLAPGLVLEQIRPEDMVFSYKGFRFRQGLQ